MLPNPPPLDPVAPYALYDLHYSCQLRHLLVHHLPHVHATFSHFPFMDATYRPNTHQKVAMQKVLHMTPFLHFL